MKVRGGLVSYGFVAGILMLDSAAPRIPGDPGHAETFSFPVRYAAAAGYSVEDMLANEPGRLSPVISAARSLEEEGVHFVAADCGLFSVFQEDISRALTVPFLGSSLSLVPFVRSFLPEPARVGIITGHTGYLSDLHLTAAGIDPAEVDVTGMEDCPEFRRVVLERAARLDVAALRDGALEAARRLLASSDGLEAMVLECPNLTPFRREIQEAFGLPVFDLVGMIEFFAEAYRLRSFSAEFLPTSDRKEAPA